MNTPHTILLGSAVPALVRYRPLRTRSADERRVSTVPLVLAAVALARGRLIDRGRPAPGAGLPFLAVTLLVQSLAVGRRARRLARFAPVNVGS
jgi:hypothetical protein